MQISSSYIKQAYSLAWRFFTQNKLASFLAMAVIVGLYVLSIIPIIGLVISIAAGIALFGLQTYVAKTLLEAKSDEEYDEMVQNSGVKEILTKYFSVASGGFVGFLIIQIIAMVLMFTSIAMSIGLETLANLNSEMMPPEEKLEIFQSVGLMGIVFVIVLLFLGYIYPIVLGKVYSSENFAEAFASAFSMFSPSVWKASLNGQYFLMVTMLHLSIILITIAMMLCIMSLVLIPVAMFLFYLMLLYVSTTAVLAKEIVLADEFLSDE